MDLFCSYVLYLMGRCTTGYWWGYWHVFVNRKTDHFNHEKPSTWAG
ncbi:MAG: hypothetical protein ACOY16_00155 [Chloroflexota bacterium]